MENLQIQVGVMKTITLFVYSEIVMVMVNVDLYSASSQKSLMYVMKVYSCVLKYL